MTAVVGEVTALLQGLIRNRCVNDGTPESGHEARNASLLEEYLTHPSIEVSRYESRAGRESIVARLAGADPAAPTLLFLTHLDVVPASPTGWTFDPFGGELRDGIVWGRGAIDMFNLTASMAVALRRMASAGSRPACSVIFVGAADEEAGGRWGVQWLWDHHPEAILSDYVITEWGGVPVKTPDGIRLWVTVGEKGICWVRLSIKGTPGHGSRPLEADNAVVTAAEVVQRLASYRGSAHIDDTWRQFVTGMAFAPSTTEALLDHDRIWSGIADLTPYLRQRAHAMTHTTVAPTVIHGGEKTNVIPDLVELDLDVRTLPGTPAEAVEEMLDSALGDLRSKVEISFLRQDGGSISPASTPLWVALKTSAAKLMPNAICLPTLTTGGTDARFFRARGIPAYGFGLFSERMTVEEFGAMFHGRNERVDQQSLALSVRLWQELAGASWVS